MIFFVLGVWIFLRTLCVDAANVSFENIALRQQLAVLQRSVLARKCAGGIDSFGSAFHASGRAGGPGC